MRTSLKYFSFSCLIVLVFSTQPPQRVVAQDDSPDDLGIIPVEATKPDTSYFEVLEDVKENCRKLQDETEDQLILLQIQQGEILEQRTKLDTLSL